jgi:hypothetical protein
MNLTPKEKFNQNVWWVLQEIKKENKVTLKNKNIYFEYQVPNDLIPSPEDQRRVLKLLENKKAIKVVEFKYPKVFAMSFVAEQFDVKPLGCFLKILQPKFNKIYKKYEKFKKENLATKKNNNIDKQEYETNYKIFFDRDKGILSICNKIVKIQKFSNQYHLLRIIFEDKLKDWQFSEISELVDMAKDFDWKHFYNSAYEIKKKIAIETGIKDFFITTTQSIKINEKYLKKS